MILERNQKAEVNNMSNPKEEIDFGKVLKSLRIANDYSVIDLADEMGISTSEIFAFESNQKQPALNDIIKYSKAFKISKAALLMLLDDAPKLKYDLSYHLYKLLVRIIEKIDIKEK